MRKIIDNTLYDTETARKIATCNVISDLCETLYQTKNGSFFLHRYHIRGIIFKRIDEEGQSLFEYTDKQAISWLNEYNLYDKIPYDLQNIFPNKLKNG